jgi:hypothetical protein
MDVLRVSDGSKRQHRPLRRWPHPCGVWQSNVPT